MGLHLDYLAKQFDISLLDQLSDETVDLVLSPVEPEETSHNLSEELLDAVQTIKKKVKKYGCSFEKIVNELMQPGDGKTRLGRYHTTDLLQCPRAAAYLRIADPDTTKTNVNFTPQQLYNFAVGKIHHCLMQGMIKAVFPKAEIEKPVVSEDLHLSGSADAVIGNELIEIKTIKAAPSFPLEKHLYQVMLYSGILRLPKWTILYIDKSSTTLKAFSGAFSTKIWDELIQTLVVLNTKYKDALPDIPPKMDRYTCSTCQWRQVCRGN
jgi:hypothetical protein